MEGSGADMGTWTVEHLGQDRVLLTGGGGFLGSFIRERLEGHVAALSVPRSRTHDLRREEVVVRLFDDFRPTLVIHAAAHGGGIGHNAKHPAKIFDDNVRMNFLVLEQARLAGVRKFVGVGSICSYPKFTPAPFRETNLWDGYPEETNAAYGLAKKMMLVQSQAYAQEYGLNAVHLLLVNLYGPRDDFSEERSHVIPALIRRFEEARREGAPEVVCWGDGTPTREFLYVEDAAEGILRAAALYDSPEPVNLGSGQEIAIRELAETIAELTGYCGRIVWDTSRPNGQPRRMLDTSRADEEFGFRARTSFSEGLRRTVDWYRAHSAAATSRSAPR
jgi:GDP-L-fucose synthase